MFLLDKKGADAVSFKIKRGQLVWVDLDGEGCEQRGRRPAIVVQNDFGNRVSPTTIIVPLTSRKTKAVIPTHVYIEADKFNGTSVKMDSIALAEQVRVIDKKRIKYYDSLILPESVMLKIDQALEIAVGLSEKKESRLIWVRLDDGIGCEQTSKNPLPAVIVQNEAGNNFAPTYIIVPVVIKKRKMIPTHTLLSKGFITDNKESVVLAEQIRTIDKVRVCNEYKEKEISMGLMESIKESLKISLGLTQKKSERKGK